MTEVEARNGALIDACLLMLNMQPLFASHRGHIAAKDVFATRYQCSNNWASLTKRHYITDSQMFNVLHFTSEI